MTTVPFLNETRITIKKSHLPAPVRREVDWMLLDTVCRPFVDMTATIIEQEAWNATDMAVTAFSYTAIEWKDMLYACIKDAGAETHGQVVMINGLVCARMPQTIVGESTNAQRGIASAIWALILHAERIERMGGSDHV